jgi:hypothetical protein
MKSRFLIFTLFIVAMCISASSAMAQSVTGTGVFGPGNGGPPVTVTASAQQGGNGGVLRFGTGQTEVIAHPVDICVQGNSAYVVGEITHASGDFAGAEGQFLNFGFTDNGKDDDFILLSFLVGPFFITPTQIPACDLLATSIPIAVPERGGWQVKP